MILASSFTLSALLTGIVKVYAGRKGFVSKPAQNRFAQRAVPLGGGIAIFLTLAFFMLSAAAVIKISVSGSASGVSGTELQNEGLNRLAEKANINPADFLGKIDQLAAILVSTFILFILGLLDDIKHLGPYLKLGVQFAAAVIVAVFAESRIEFFIENKFITTLFSVLWIVLIINVFNFLDNMDGLSVGIAIITGCILLTASVTSGQVFVGGLTIVFVGALLGFLIFNFPPAGIFMGDSGSLVIGFFVALLSLRTTYYHEAQSGQWYPVFLPLIVLAVPLYDFISVTLLRISQGKSPLIGDTQHFSHRMKKRGLSDRRTVLVLYLATLAAGLGGTFLYQVNLTGAILIFIQTFLILIVIAVFEATG